MAKVHVSRRVVFLVAIVGLGVAMGTLLAIRPRDPLSRASTAYARGDWAEAATQARAAVFARSGNHVASRLLARAYARLGRNAASRGIYQRLGADSMEAEDLALLGQGLLREGQTAPAVHALRAALDIEPNHPEALDTLSAHLASKGSSHEATEAAGRLAKVAGWEVRGLARLGPLLHNLRDPAGAAAALDGALTRDSMLAGTDLKPGEARKLLASSLLEVGRADDAARTLKAGPSTASREDPEIAWLLSRVALQQGRASDALRFLEHARSASATKPDPMRLEPAPFVGEAACTRCHSSIAQAKRNSRHSRTIVKPGELTKIPWPISPIADQSNPSVTHEFFVTGRQVKVATTFGDRKLEALIEFALGSNTQGQSYIARDAQGRTRELRISRYPSEPTWDKTTEHPTRPSDETGYLGRPISEASRFLCLDCHATNFRAAEASPADRPESLDKGIGCERCHGPGGNHILAVAMKFPELAIARPRLAHAERVMALCGECHKSPSTLRPEDPRLARFQVPALAQSRCYTQSNGRMSCVTCHDPHRDAERSQVSYEAKCLGCHASGLREPAKASTVCKVNPSSNCLHCHMPEMSGVFQRSSFTDHFIRIRREPADHQRSAN